MPDSLDLSFDVACPLRARDFSVSLFADGVNESGAGTLTVAFIFSGRSTAATPYLVQLQESDGAAKGLNRYRLLADRVNGRLLVYIDGVERAEWTLAKTPPADIAKHGGTFTFTPRGTDISLWTYEIGRMRLLPWDGKEPADGAEPAALKNDQVLADNGASATGRIERITDAEVILANPEGAVRRGGTLQMRFADPRELQTPPVAGALVRLKNGSEFAAGKIAGAGAGVTFTARFGSHVTLTFSALRQVEFLTEPGQAEPSAKGPNVLTLTDGTQWRGRLVTPVSGDTLRWKIAASKTPIEFSSERVAGVFLPAAKGQAENSTPKGSAILRLRNGDRLQGDVVSLDAERFMFRTDLMPDIVDVPRASVHGLYMSSEGISTLVDGATGPDSWIAGWTSFKNMHPLQSASISKSGQPWIYHDGGYTLSRPAPGATLARKLPAISGRYAVHIEISNPGPDGSFVIQFFNSKDEPTFTIRPAGGVFSVAFNPGASAMSDRPETKQFHVDGLTETAGAKLRIAAVLDREERTFRVFVSGTEIGNFRFKAQGALDVTGVALTPMSPGPGNSRQSSIAGIWVAPWTGSSGPSGSAETKEAKAPGAEPKQAARLVPTIYLVNGDDLTGMIGC